MTHTFDTGPTELVDDDGDGWPDTSHQATSEIVPARSADVVPAQRRAIDVFPRRIGSPGAGSTGTGPVTGQRVVLAAWQVGAGHTAWVKRAHSAATHGVIREQISAARAAGDSDALHAAQTLLIKAKNDRSRRLRELPKATLAVLQTSGWVLAGLLAVLLVVIPLITLIGAGTQAVGSWYSGLRSVVTFGVSAGQFVLPLVFGPLGIIALVLLWFGGAYVAGSKTATPPGWLAPTADVGDGRSMIPTDSSILEALRYLGIPKLDQAFKAGWGTTGHPSQVWEQGVARDGLGYRCLIRLPKGVNVKKVNDAKDLLAHNLVRMPAEVWPSERKDKPGVLDLWIANSGALTGPIPEWPLLAELSTVTTDYFAGLPVGINIRGDVIKAIPFQSNLAAAGIMGSGKSSLVITWLLGMLLDPLVEADVFVCAENFDYEPMRPRLRQLRTGQGKATIQAIMRTLREAYEELEVRGQALREHGERAVKRSLAEKDARLRPRVFVIDECQALFLDPKYGEEAQDLVVLLENASRKYGYTIIYLTPEASSASLPRRVVAVTSLKACYAIGDQTSNDSILGSGSYKSGVSAVGLEPKTDEGPGDVGTAMTRGFMAKPGLMRTFYTSAEVATLVTERALEIRAAAGIDGEKVEDVVERDFLADLSALLGDLPRLGTDEMRQRLASLDRGAYGKWSARDFADALRKHKMPTGRKSDGIMVVRADDLADAIEGAAAEEAARQAEIDDYDDEYDDE
jgi:S-DNA-T family DNA segregation ATPase FtsK/SpoIIIE